MSVRNESAPIGFGVKIAGWAMNSAGCGVTAALIGSPLGALGGAFAGAACGISIIALSKLEHYCFEENGPLAELSSKAKLIASIASFVLVGAGSAYAATLLAGYSTACALSTFTVIPLTLALIGGIASIINLAKTTG